jgi:hypothetical protein
LAVGRVRLARGAHLVVVALEKHPTYFQVRLLWMPNVVDIPQRLVLAARTQPGRADHARTQMIAEYRAALVSQLGGGR